MEIELKRTLLVLGLMACSTPPKLTGVEPKEVPPGAAVTLMGEGFGDGATVQLVASGAPAGQLADLSVKGPVVLEGKVPDGTADGTYDLVLDVGGQAVTLPGALVVKAPFVDTPCGTEYTANTQFSIARKVVVIDRFYKSGEKETVKTPFDAIERIEYELVEKEGGGYCSVVYLKKTNGTRLRYADDDKQDLKSLAYKFANDMGKAIEVTREDAPAMPEATADGDEGASE